METKVVPVCRSCKNEINAQTNLNDEKLKPKEGDYSICVYCGVISRFDSDMNLKPLPSDGLIKLNEEDQGLYDELIRIQKLILQTI